LRELSFSPDYCNVRHVFQRRIRHPFYPALKPAPAADAKELSSALTGTFAELEKASAAGVQVARAVFPLHSPASPFLTSEQRDALWAMFEVPVLAMLIDHRGSVIGYECELQEGFHLKEEFAGGLLFGRIESSLCECGRPGPRLMPPEEHDMPQPLSLSAAAD
jgi:hypothetical protein